MKKGLITPIKLAMKTIILTSEGKTIISNCADNSGRIPSVKATTTPPETKMLLSNALFCLKLSMKGLP